VYSAARRIMLRRALLALLLVPICGAAVDSALAATPERLLVQPQLVSHNAGTYPLVSGRYTVLSLSKPYGTYVVLDDQTGARFTVGYGSRCGLWANAFATPWMVFECDGAPALYNVQTHQLTGFPCGQPCADVGVAAPGAIGSHWLYMNENAYCEPRYAPCNVPNVYVALPSGRVGSYTPNSRTLLDLNSPGLSETICAPWSQPPTGSLSMDGNFVVLQSASGVAVTRCGSTRVLPLVTGANVGLIETAHLIATCPATPYGLGSYQGVFLPSLQRFTLVLPATFSPCDRAYVDNGALYLWAESGEVWRTVLPTGPLPTYTSCPATAGALRSTNPNAFGQLAPAGASEALLCRYRTTKPRRLAASRLIVDRSELAGIQRAFDQLPGGRSGRGGRRCPTAATTTVTVLFRYPTADDVPVSISAGCQAATNDHLLRSTGNTNGRHLLQRLLAHR
jgi:hypothetical protein